MTRTATKARVLVAALVTASGLAGHASSQTRAATFEISAPSAEDSPATAGSHPFLAADHDLVPTDLGAEGYAERELLVSGKARVYDWDAAKQLTVNSEVAPYTTRILIRAPKDAAKFSGNVVVEVMYDARAYDWAMMWSYLHESIVRNGDVWVGVTTPKSGGTLKTFDPKRYAALTFAPSAPLSCKTGENGDAIEEGVRFDMLAQIGVLLKSEAADNPLKGWAPRRLFMTEQNSDANAYAAVFQTRLVGPGGKPIYDGFLLKGAGGLPKLNHCGQAVPNSDPRSVPHGIGAPVIATYTPGEIAGALANRREDSDTRSDPFRRYEIAAANHLDRTAYRGFPSLEDQKRAGVLQGTADWPFTARCTPEIQLSDSRLMQVMFDGAMQNLQIWARGGPPAPKGARIALVADGKSVQLDRNGISVGGIRTVYSDAPTFTEALGSPGPGNCREIGATNRFSWPYLAQLYGSPQAYVAKAVPMVDGMEKARWVTHADAEILRAELRAPPAPPAITGPARGAE